MIIIGLIMAGLLIVGANRNCTNNEWPRRELRAWWRDWKRKD